MTTSLIIPVYNGAHVLSRTVAAALAVGADETVYVDDGSTDATADVLTRLTAGRADVRVLRHATNQGRAAARMTGVAATAGAVLLFLDADVTPHPGYLDALRGAFDREGTVAAVGRVVPGDADPTSAYHRYLGSPRRGPQGAGRTEWRHLITGVAAVRRSAFAAVGGFDPRIVYGEDLALACALAARHPDGLLSVPDATATIYDLGTLDDARRNVARFAQDLPQIAARCPDVYRVARLERLVSPRPTDWLLRALARWALPAAVATRGVDWLPPAHATGLVRYLLGHTLVATFRDAPSARLRP